MLQIWARLFDKRTQEETSAESLEEREHDIRLATAALLFEVVRADGRIEDAERSVMRAAIQSTFDLPSSEIDELMRLAETASHQAASLYEFTHRVDTAFSAEQKKRIVELLWLVTFADAQKDALEEHLVRKIAGLLHVSHPDFIDAKIRARSARAATAR
jgi:uncharacterized tellurite resistance protein B-like protein